MFFSVSQEIYLFNLWERKDYAQHFFPINAQIRQKMMQLQLLKWTLEALPCYLFRNYNIEEVAWMDHEDFPTMWIIHAFFFDTVFSLELKMLDLCDETHCPCISIGCDYIFTVNTVYIFALKGFVPIFNRFLFVKEWKRWDNNCFLDRPWIREGLIILPLLVC